MHIRSPDGPKGEIVLPCGKRGLFVTLKNSLQFTNDEKWVLVFNFTPAASVTVVDLEARRILSDIDLPGCSLTYPTGQRGFARLCADGTMTTIALDEAGGVASTVSGEPFNDIDNDPMFMTSAMVGRTAWFVTFKGTLRGIDFAGAAPRDLGSFPLPAEDGGDPEWRPGGWQVITADANGLVYVLMNPETLRSPVREIAGGAWRGRAPRRLLRGKFAVVAALESALAAFEQGTDLGQCLAAAVSRPGDTQAAAAITGQLAGACYGASGLGAELRAGLARAAEIEALADRLLDAAPRARAG